MESLEVLELEKQKASVIKGVKVLNSELLIEAQTNGRTEKFESLYKNVECKIVEINDLHKKIIKGILKIK